MNKSIKIIFSGLCILCLVTFFFAIKKSQPGRLSFYFLPVGQGDSSLVVAKTGEKILIDTGPDETVTQQLIRVIPQSDHYLDILILSHTDKDHIGGTLSVLEKYDIGMILGTARKNTTEVYQALRSQIVENKIPFVGLEEGDRIHIGDITVEVLAPSEQEVFGSAENETSLVLKVITPEASALYTGDIGAAIEERITKDHDVNVDVLKVAHHGSRFSSSEAFLQEVTPAVAVISVGKNNYGHPAPQTMERLKHVTQTILRTDEKGIIKITPEKSHSLQLKFF